MNSFYRSPFIWRPLGGIFVWGAEKYATSLSTTVFQSVLTRYEHHRVKSCFYSIFSPLTEQEMHSSCIQRTDQSMQSHVWPSPSHMNPHCVSFCRESSEWHSTTVILNIIYSHTLFTYCFFSSLPGRHTEEKKKKSTGTDRTFRNMLCPAQKLILLL